MIAHSRICIRGSSLRGQAGTLSLNGGKTVAASLQQNLLQAGRFAVYQRSRPVNEVLPWYSPWSRTRRLIPFRLRFSVANDENVRQLLTG